MVPSDEKNLEGWSSEDKFAVVLETAPLNAAALAEYWRRKGLYPEQITNLACRLGVVDFNERNWFATADGCLLCEKATGGFGSRVCENAMIA